MAQAELKLEDPQVAPQASVGGEEGGCCGGACCGSQ